MGMPLALELSHKGFEVKGSTRSSDKFEQMRLGGISPYAIQLSDRYDMIADFLSSEVLIIAVPSKNVDDFRYLIDRIEKSQVQKVLFVSSTSVYVSANQIATEECETPASPLSEIESMLRESARFKTTVLRFGGLFGYDRQPGRFHRDGKVIDNPEGYVNLIHRDDCIRIIEQIIEQNIWGETLNACADTHPTRRDFYTKEALRLGMNTPPFDELSLTPYKIISSEKLKRLLNFSFKYADLMDYSGE